jgi:hypothetical protein
MDLKKIYLGILFLLLTGVIAPLSVYSQSESHTEEEGSDHETIILSPATDSQVYQTAGDGEYSSLTGLIVGNGVFGVETMVRQPGARADLSFTLSAYYDGEDSVIRDGNLLIGALSVGRDYTVSEFTNSAGKRKAEIYFRVAPGFGVAGRGIIENGSSQYFPGVTATTEFGVIYHFTDRVSLFTNAGGRYYWFPGLDEFGLMSRPAVMIGMQFNFTGGLGMVRF